MIKSNTAIILNEEMVSIITPLYNGMQYVVETVQSVLNQTHQNWELLIIDDCSTDGGPAIAEKYQQQDARIRLIRNERNLGPALTRNRGIEAATGRYIAFLDSDDLWYPNKLEVQLKFMEDNSIPFSFSHYRQIDEKGKFIRNVDSIPAEITYNDLLKFNYIGCLTAMYDTLFFDKVYMSDIRNRQDYALWLTLVKKSNKAYCIDEPLASYRIRKDSISSNKIKLVKYHWHIYYKIEQLGLLKSVYLVSNYILRKLFYK